MPGMKDRKRLLVTPLESSVVAGNRVCSMESSSNGAAILAVLRDLVRFRRADRRRHPTSVSANCCRGWPWIRGSVFHSVDDFALI